ncbi:hypothetical protein BGW37DRAFT_28932 [Umbelopsis sp. PMI_123]|nr:hypothetical protein BGW37DRAFT_28932 [Umbelopsis sp. PMI_123]
MIHQVKHNIYFKLKCHSSSATPCLPSHPLALSPVLLLLPPSPQAKVKQRKLNLHHSFPAIHFNIVQLIACNLYAIQMTMIYLANASTKQVVIINTVIIPHVYIPIYLANL